MVPVVTRKKGLGLYVRNRCACVYPMRRAIQPPARVYTPCVRFLVCRYPNLRKSGTTLRARAAHVRGARAARGRRDGGSGGEPKLSLMLTSPHQNHRKTEIPKIPRHKSVAIFAMFDHLGAFPLLRPKLHEYHPTPTNTARYLTST